MTHDIRPMQEKSVDEIEGATLAPPYLTGMIERIARARALPMGALELGDLRLLVSQGEALQYLMPLTLDHLERTPLIWAELYVGDLLIAALHAHHQFNETPAAGGRLQALVERALDQLSTIGPTDWEAAGPFDPNAPDEIDREQLEPKLRDALAQLTASRPAV